jgi:hypothetical protein
VRFVRSGVQVFAADFARHRRSEPCLSSSGPAVCPIPTRDRQDSWR